MFSLFKKFIDFLNNAVLVSENNSVEFGNIFSFMCFILFVIIHSFVITCFFIINPITI